MCYEVVIKINWDDTSSEAHMSWRHSWPVTGQSTEEPIETTNQQRKSQSLNYLLQWYKQEGNVWESTDSRFGTVQTRGGHLTVEGDWTKAQASQVAQWEGICLAVQEAQETWVQPVGMKDALEEEMATHSSILA